MLIVLRDRRGALKLLEEEEETVGTIQNFCTFSSRVSQEYHFIHTGIIEVGAKIQNSSLVPRGHPETRNRWIIVVFVVVSNYSAAPCKQASLACFLDPACTLCLLFVMHYRHCC